MDATAARRRLADDRARLIDLRDVEQRTHDDAAGGDGVAEADQHRADAPSETFEREKEESIVASLEQQIADIDAALARIDDGSYGRCVVCGKDIGEERLAGRPATPYCIEHQAEAERLTRAGREPGSGGGPSGPAT